VFLAPYRPTAQRVLERGGAVGPLVADLDDQGAGLGQAALARPGRGGRARAGDDHGTLGDLERLLARAAQLALAHQVVDRRARGQHHAGSDHRPAAHQHPLVDAGVAAQQHVVLDDHRPGPDGLEHAADLGRRGDVHALADLGARAHQGVAVDHRAGADEGAHVDVHGRHADHPAPQVGAAPHRRAAGHQAHAAVGGEALRHERGLVHEGPQLARGPGTDLDHRRGTEDRQDLLLDPAVDGPGAVGATLGHAHLARLQRVEQRLAREVRAHRPSSAAARASSCTATRR
jgi:hypothetical protein